MTALPSSPTLLLAQALLARPSVTPDDAGCMDLIRQRIEPLGFVCEDMSSGPASARVRNLWARRAAATATSSSAQLTS